MVVRNDGSAVLSAAKRGLGAAIFDAMAPGRWGRRSDDRGTVVWVELEPTSQIQR